MPWRFLQCLFVFSTAEEPSVYRLPGNGLAEFGFVGSLCPDPEVTTPFTINHLFRLSMTEFYRSDLARCPGDARFLDAKTAPKTFCSNGDATSADRSMRTEKFNQFIMEGIMLTR